MNKPKRQHWVPRFYLKEFSIDPNRKEPQVWIFSNSQGEPQCVNIKDIAVKKYLYTPRDSSIYRDWYMEEKLASLESTISFIWPQFANDFIDLSDDSNRKIISLFLATLYLRNPKRIQEYSDFQNYLIDYYKKLPIDGEEKPNVSYVEINGKKFDFDTSDWNEYSNPTTGYMSKLFVDYIEKIAIHIAEELMNKRWSVIVSDKREFITSDHPLILTNKNSKSIEAIGFGKKGATITFPISPTRVLVLDDLYDEPPSQYYQIKPDTAPSINFLSWLNSYQFMITHKNPDEVLYEVFEGAIYA